MQQQACWTRRGAGGRQFVKGNGYIAAAFTHRSSRAGDPQLHTHVLIANATKGPDGRWSRLYHPAIYQHAKTAGYIYEAQLRHELSHSLGVKWQEVRNGIAEIEGFEDRHLREFSTRRQQILAAVGPDASARARQVATLITREAKEQGVSRESLHARWQGKAKEIGLDPETIAKTFDPELARALPDPYALAAARTISYEQVDRAVTAGVSHFDCRDAIQAVASSLPNGAPAAEVQQIADAFLASEAVIRIAEGPKGERFTTRRIWELERSALETAERMRIEGRSPAGELTAARVIRSHPSLKADQREMVSRLLGEREGVVVVIGEAGTGKTYAIAAAAQGWAQAGIELRSAAPTWRAANVLRPEGLPATSIASLLPELDRDALPRRSVLLIDEAGMVDSATLARLISHADRAEAKLVLIGDPQQLGEIEAGGLFRALAERSDPIYLDEVIRHRYDLDREATKRIREGHGAQALDLYRSEQRVIVAPNAESRREAMVSDWHQAFAGGEDAVMIAKRNAEVDRLNELARAVMAEQGRLGGTEIEVGEARFAAGDQVITRVNDHANQIYNRERWQVTAVDAEEQRVTLEGIDQPRQVELDADYLSRTNPHSDAPALEHGYAINTYSAQGATVDRAFVAADPSMDKQESYVAASRSRGETHLYATPEIQAEREEYAPRSPYLREDLEHIEEAFGRDGAQIAAHDVDLQAEFSALPTEELLARRNTLTLEASRERSSQEYGESLRERIAETEELLADATAKREAAEALPRRQREPELTRAQGAEILAEQGLDRLHAEAQAAEPAQYEARAQLALAEQILAERQSLALTAVHISPPDYITEALGERPADPVKRQDWERGVGEIETYRQKHGITDPDKALGREPTDGWERSDWRAGQRRLAEHQQALGVDHGLDQGPGAGDGEGDGDWDVGRRAALSSPFPRTMALPALHLLSRGERKRRTERAMWAFRRIGAATPEGSYHRARAGSGDASMGGSRLSRDGYSDIASTAGSGSCRGVARGD